MPPSSPIVVDVTWQDTSNGVRRSRCSCSVSLALRRVTGSICHVGSTYAYATSATIEKERRIYLPLAARRFISLYDHGVKVKPFSFVVEAK